MNNTTGIKTRTNPPSSERESTDSFVYQPRKSVLKSKIHSNHIFSISHFLHLIVITSVIFCAGGFGFGVALRYGQTWQNSSVLATDNSPTSAHNYQ